MRKLMFILCLLSMSAFADVQIDQQNKDAHVPYDEDNTDNEFYVTPIKTSVIVQSGVTSVIAEAEAILLCWRVPPQFDGLDVGRSIVLTDETVDETCLITDVNGTQYVSDDWMSRTIIMSECVYFSMKVKHQIWCSMGMEQ